MTILLKFAITLVFLSLTSGFKLKLNNMPTLKVQETVGLNKVKQVNLDDMDKYVLEKIKVDEEKMILRLNYEFEEDIFVITSKEGPKGGKVFVNKTNPFIVWSIYLDGHSDEAFLRLAKRLKTRTIRGLKRILKFLNKIEWTSPLLIKFNQAKMFESGKFNYTGFSSFNKTKTLIRDFLFNERNLVKKKLNTLHMTTRMHLKTDSKVYFHTTFIYFLRTIRSEIFNYIYPNGEDFINLNLEDYDDLIETNKKQKNFGAAKTLKIMKSISQIIIVKMKEMDQAFDDEKIDLNELALSEAVLNKFETKIQPILEGKLYFFVQVFLNVIKKSYISERQTVLREYLMSIEEFSKNTYNEPKSSAKLFLLKVIMNYIYSRIITPSEKVKRDYKFVKIFKKTIYFIFKIVIDNQHEFGLDIEQMIKFKTYLTVRFRDIQKFSLEIAPQNLLFFFEIKSSLDLMLSTYLENDALNLEFSIKPKSYTDQLFEFAHRLGYDTEKQVVSISQAFDIFIQDEKKDWRLNLI